MASNSWSWRSLFGRRAEPKSIEEVGQRPIQPPGFRDALGRTLVARVRVKGDLVCAVRDSLALLSGASLGLRPGDSPLLLPRFGSGPAPLSTSPDFLAAVVEVLREQGARSVRVLDARSAAYPEPPGLAETCKAAGCELVEVRDGPWVRVQVGGSLESVTIPRVAYEAEKLALLPSPLVNSVTRFTMALALPQELLHSEARSTLGKVRREERLVEVNLAVRPWLVLMDARSALVSKENLLIREPGYVLASGDPIALDVAALKLLKGYPAKNKLDLPAWGFPQITAAIQLGLGATREDDTRLVEW
ncbi:MAG: DUF362 domain-containing protein [Chloroflexota bacterium]|nr:DUF362 domain-containing protein [Chloroflexota bacterium]